MNYFEGCFSTTLNQYCIAYCDVQISTDVQHCTYKEVLKKSERWRIYLNVNKPRCTQFNKNDLEIANNRKLKTLKILFHFCHIL